MINNPLDINKTSDDDTLAEMEAALSGGTATQEVEEPTTDNVTEFITPEPVADVELTTSTTLEESVTPPEATPVPAEVVAAAQTALDDVKFTANPAYVNSALKKVLSVHGDTETQFVAAIKTKDSNLHMAHGISEELNDGVILFGAATDTGDYIITEIPAVEIEKEGLFLIREASNLASWTGEVKSNVTIEHIREEDDKTFLQLTHEKGNQKLPSLLYWTVEGWEDWFSAAAMRFDTPSESSTNAGLASMIARAEKIAPTGTATSTGRTGNIIWNKDTVEFATMTAADEHTLSASLKAEHKSDYQFNWDITVAQLKSLNAIHQINGGTYQIEESGTEDDPFLAFQMAYTIGLTKNGTDEMRVHQQLAIQKPERSIKVWIPEEQVDDSFIFESDECKLFASVPTKELINSLKQIWALNPNTMVKVEKGYDSDTNTILSLFSGRAEDPDVNEVSASHGDSNIDTYYLHPDVLGMLTSFLDGATSFQIRSFPAAVQVSPGDEPVVQEIPNAYILVPLQDGDDPTEKKNDPDRYLIISWNE